MRVYPDLDVSLVPAPTVIIVGLPAGLRLAVDNAIANAVKHGGATRVQLSAVSSRAGVEIAIDDDGVGVPEEERSDRVRQILPRLDGIAFRLRARARPGRPAGRIARRHSLSGGESAWRRPPATSFARSELVRAETELVLDFAPKLRTQAQFRLSPIGWPAGR